jgi:alkylated DNA repair dioxygenase AlkB
MTAAGHDRTERLPERVELRIRQRVSPAHQISGRTVVARQRQLFGDTAEDIASMPEGLRYEPGFVDPRTEADLVRHLRTLELKPFEFHGHRGNRRVVSFGLRYDYDQREVQSAPQIPTFLDELRAKAAAFANRSAQEVKQVGINEYQAGAGIGWHRDKPEFGDVIGVSLLMPAKMRLRRQDGQKWERRSLILQPRSIYVLSGASRREWEHSIPPVEALRYSIMFRTLADD